MGTKAATNLNQLRSPFTSNHSTCVWWFIPFGFFKRLGKSCIIHCSSHIFLSWGIPQWFHWVPQFKNTPFVFDCKYGASFKIDAYLGVSSGSPLFSQNILWGTYPMFRNIQVYMISSWFVISPSIPQNGRILANEMNLGRAAGPAKWRTNCCCLGGPAWYSGFWSGPQVGLAEFLLQKTSDVVWLGQVVSQWSKMLHIDIYSS